MKKVHLIAISAIIASSLCCSTVAYGNGEIELPKIPVNTVSETQPGEVPPSETPPAPQDTATNWEASEVPFTDPEQSTAATTAAAANKKPKATTIKKLKKGKKSFKVTWKKISKVKGYQIQYCTSKKFKKKVKGKKQTLKSITVKGAKKTSKTVKKLKAKKTYYVRVRTYKTDKGKKIYSKWSKVKSVKTK